MSGCLLRLVLLPLCVAALYPLFCLRSPFPTLVLGAEGAEAAALLAGICTWWVIISGLDARQIASTIALAKAWQLRDGEKAVIAGHIKARGQTLTAPFSGDKCVGYCYKVTHHASHPNMKTTEWTDFEGFALVPSTIRGPLRTVNLLARPDEDLFAEVPSRETTREEDWARAEAYLNATDFGEKPKDRLADTRKRLIGLGPGGFREDKQVGDPPMNLRDCRPSKGSLRLEQGRHRLAEAIVREGDKVMLAGVFHAQSDGIGPDPDDIMRPFRLLVGGEAPLRHKLRNRVFGIAIAGALAAATATTYFAIAAGVAE